MSGSNMNTYTIYIGLFKHMCRGISLGDVYRWKSMSSSISSNPYDTTLAIL